MKVKLTTIDDVKNFCNLACQLESDVFLKSNRYVVDGKSLMGKSLMGIFSLSLDKMVEMEIVSRDDREIDSFLSQLSELNILKAV